LQILGRWADVLREVFRAPNGLDALARVVRYILEINEHVRPEALQAWWSEGTALRPSGRVDVAVAFWSPAEEQDGPTG